MLDFFLKKGKSQFFPTMVWSYVMMVLPNVTKKTREPPDIIIVRS